MNNPNNTAEAVPSLSDAEAMCQRLENYPPALDKYGTEIRTPELLSEAAAFIRSLQQRNAELEGLIREGLELPCQNPYNLADWQDKAGASLTPGQKGEVE